MQDKRDDAGKSPREDKAKTPNQIPAGPHARPELTDYEKTPGTGSLPDEKGVEGDVGPD